MRDFEPQFRSRGRSGFTVLELVIGLALLAVLSVNIMWVLSATTNTSENETAQVILEDHTQTVLKRIALAIMRSSRETLEGDMAAPLSSDELQYSVQIGMENGEPVWDDPEAIAMDDVNTSIAWTKNPAAPEELRVVWTNLVRPLLEGEEMNGIDDNGNGLVDEKGLSFTVDRNAVTVRLSLERRRSDGTVLTRTVESTVTCRNPSRAGL